MPVTVPPKPAASRQRRNRNTAAASLEATPAVKVPLPKRLSEFKCLAKVDRKRGCPLAEAWHDLEHFAKQEVEPHEFVPAEKPWHPMTVSWWDTIWDSPMAGEWVQADVPELLLLAAAVEQFWTTGDLKAAAEVRMRNREFGLTPLARRMLQWEIVKVEGASRARPPSRPVKDPRQLLQAVK